MNLQKLKPINMNKKKNVYIISGPCGVGKSTMANEISKNIENNVVISGDDIMSEIEKENKVCWEELLLLTWKKILSLTKNLLRNNVNVIVDYVIEDELEWFCKNIEALNAEVKYVVLIASEETIKARLEKRGDSHLLERSLFLLEKLKNAIENKNNVYDTDDREVSEIANDLLNTL